jgi:hypothetical protein
VAFVLIGGAAIQSHGRRFDTKDVDVTPDADQANLERLAAVLNGLGCRLVTDSADSTAWVPLPPDYFTPRSLLAASVWNLATRHGQLDLSFTPSGFPGSYRDLARGAAFRRVAGTAITVLGRVTRRHPRIEARSESAQGSGVPPRCQVRRGGVDPADGHREPEFGESQG